MIIVNFLTKQLVLLRKLQGLSWPAKNKALHLSDPNGQTNVTFAPCKF